MGPDTLRVFALTDNYNANFFYKKRRVCLKMGTCTVKELSKDKKVNVKKNITY